MTPYRLAFPLALLVLVTGCEGPALDNAQNPEAPGEVIFLNHCAGCHQLQGPSPMSMANLAQTSPRFKSAQAFTAFLRDTDKATMPSFAPDMLPDSDAQVLYDFLAGRFATGGP